MMSDSEQRAPCQWPLRTDDDRRCGEPSVGYTDAVWMGGPPISGELPVCQEHLDRAQGRST